VLATISRWRVPQGASITSNLHFRSALTRAAMLRIGACWLGAALVAGCAYHGGDTVDAHYQRYSARMPEGDRVFACSAYGCRTQTPFRFTDADIAKLQSMMSAAKTKSAADERAATRDTLAWMEHRVDVAVGTANDRPGDDFGGSGDPTQMDCVDVATNLSSYLLILDRQQLLRHHTVGGVYVKEDYRKGVSGWTHYAAILIEKGSSQKFAVDGWLLASGKPPEIIETQKWYIDDSDILIGKGGEPPVPETTGSIASAAGQK
jgi:hypothetical protein